MWLDIYMKNSEDIPPAHKHTSLKCKKAFSGGSEVLLHVLTAEPLKRKPSTELEWKTVAGNAALTRRKPRRQRFHFVQARHLNGPVVSLKVPR